MKGRKNREAGGVNMAAEDLRDKPARRNNADAIFSEAEERKRGGRMARKRGGKACGEVEGMEAKKHAGRKARKSGGSCEANPFSSARNGESPKGHKVETEFN